MKTTIKILFTLLLCVQTIFKSRADVSVYFAAHQDDWQLFMGTNAYLDMVASQTDPNNRVIIFHITGGDGGEANTMSYVKAREDCAMNSIRLACNAGTNIGATTVSSYVVANGHSVLCKTYGNTVSYFLRLPDGCAIFPGPTNFNGCLGMGSLHGLYSGAWTSVSAVDFSTSYNGWNDLVNTIAALVNPYYLYNNIFYPGSRININHPDINLTFNTWDHQDHWHTGKLAIDACKQYCPYFISYVNYNSSSLSPNLSADDTENESALFGACTLALVDNGWNSTWEPLHKRWLVSNYFRVWTPDCSINPHKITTFSQVQDDSLLRQTFEEQLGNPNITGTHDAINSDMINLFPNPVTDRLQISISSKSGKNGENSSISGKIEVLDLLGHSVIKTVFGQNYVDVKDLNPGAYYLKIYMSADRFALRKFVKE